MFDLLIRRGQLVSEDGIRVQSIAVSDGRVAALIAVAGGIAILIFSNVWLNRGLGAALLLVAAVLLLAGWLFDRRERKARGGLDELPPI